MLVVLVPLRSRVTFVRPVDPEQQVRPLSDADEVEREALAHPLETSGAKWRNATHKSFQPEAGAESQRKADRHGDRVVGDEVAARSARRARQSDAHER